MGRAGEKMVWNGKRGKNGQKVMENEGSTAGKVNAVSRTKALLGMSSGREDRDSSVLDPEHGDLPRLSADVVENRLRKAENNRFGSMVDLKGVDLSKRSIGRVHRHGVDLRGANCAGVVARDGAFNGSDLSGAVFDRAHLQNTQFTETTAEGADFSGSFMSYGEVTDSCFDGVNMSGAQLGSATLSGSTFVQGFGVNMEMSKAKASGCDFSGGNWEMMRGDQVQLKGCDFSNSTINGSRFRSWDMCSDFSGTDFSRCAARDVKFGDSVMKNTDFRDTDLTGSDFSEVRDLSGSEFAGADVSGAVFNQLSVEGVDLSGTTGRYTVQRSDGGNQLCEAGRPV